MALQMKRGRLELKSGMIFYGFLFGKAEPVSGEVVFQTGMVGYPESLTDPSYKYQLLVLTYPHIGNYGVADCEAVDEYGIHINMESNQIHAAALIVADYCDDYSHYKAIQSLNNWLLKEGVPGITGIDTRLLTQQLREHGSLLGRISIANELNPNIWLELPWQDPNSLNLVSLVSIPSPKQYFPKIKMIDSSNSTPPAPPPHIAVIDCGLKNNQLRCLLHRGAKLTVFPWNENPQKWEKENPNELFDALFISNGPGDPQLMRDTTVKTVQHWLQTKRPLMGICLGHQLTAEAIGCSTYKLKFGNRGHNQPCMHLDTQRCFITTQNHGYCVDSNTIPSGWCPLFTNLNDKTNEGLIHETLPFFTVQFHPEHCAGPQDLELLFDVFLDHVCAVRDNVVDETTSSLRDRLTKALVYHPQDFECSLQSIRNKEKPFPKKVLVLGSGGLSIGQAGEFDYSGSQALKALKEEGIETILVNPNIATVQTSTDIADRIYLLPIDVFNVSKVIEAERPDGILLTFGGQTALNCGLELAKFGVFDKYQVQIFGTQLHSIELTEDRQLFAEEMASINEFVAPSKSAYSVEEALRVANELGYPVLVRAAFTLGGHGSGFADNEEQMRELASSTLHVTKQLIIDKSLRGWKEIEYEVVRDAYDNCITVCNMENIDPLGIHTGESIVVAPSQTLTNDDYQRLRSTAIKVIRHLGIVGECNIQYAVDPHSDLYYIIEVNARLSRSSALASKATGYPLAYVAAKLNLGYALHDLLNSVTKSTSACFEPSLDYCVVKIPRWDLHKFSKVNKNIGSSMKSIGEVMGIGRTFEEAFQKALRMMDDKIKGFDPFVKKNPDQNKLSNPTHRRIFVLSAALYQNWSVELINQLTNIDLWFLNKMKNITDMYTKLQQEAKLTRDSLGLAKRLGFSDRQISECTNITEMAVRKQRQQWQIVPVVRQIDTVAAEFPAKTNYLYVTYHGDTNDVVFDNSGPEFVMVLGSGVYHIGSSVEFDWCAVDCIRELRKLNYSTIMINCNPETVSTDYDMCDRLYFEEISLERVLDIYEIEDPIGVVVCMGGQLPNNIVMPLHRQNVRILGTSAESIDNAENRFKFSRMLDRIGIAQPRWKELSTMEEAKRFCHEVGYPCLIRPSYVLSGAAMNVAYDDTDLQSFLTQATAINRDHPVVISKFILEAKEIDVDAVACDGNVIAMAISEHVENAGVHSGDATLVTPPQDLNRTTQEKISRICLAIAMELKVTGPLNMQLIAKDNDLSVIECNVRVSRSFPFVSKTLDFDFIAAATQVIMRTGSAYNNLVPHASNHNNSIPLLTGSGGRVGVKVPVFSFSRLRGADVLLGVEMSSTGEVACFGNNRYEAYLKAQISAGLKIPKENILITIGSYKHKVELLESIRQLKNLGFQLFASIGTADFYQEHGIAMTALDWVPEEKPSRSFSCDSNKNDRHPKISDLLTENKIDLLISLAMRSTVYRCASSFVTHGYRTRRMAIDYGVPVLSDIKCVKLFVEALRRCNCRAGVSSVSLTMDFTEMDCLTKQNIFRIPGGLVDVHVHTRDPGHEYKEDWKSVSSAAIAGGITTILAMPNTRPPLVDQESYELIQEKARLNSHCDFGLYVGATSTNWQLWSDPTRNNFLQNVVALKMYLNETFTELRLDNMMHWMKHFELFPKDKLICCHAEGASLASVLLLAQLYKRSVHICHVARAEEIELIRVAKLQNGGAKITCEVTPHHLFLTEDDVPENWREVRPKLGSRDDIEALWQNMNIIDCIASDHAPHTRGEKAGDCGYVPPGFPGLETTLPLLFTAVKDNKLTLQDIVDKLSLNPRKIFHLPPPREDTWIDVDLDAQWELPALTTSFGHSKAGWTPFAGKQLHGKLRRVVFRGNVVFVDGKVLSEAGIGCEVSGSQFQRIGGEHAEGFSTPKSPYSSTIRPVAQKTSKAPESLLTAPSPFVTAPNSRPPSPKPSSRVKTYSGSGGLPQQQSIGVGGDVNTSAVAVGSKIPLNYWHAGISGRNLLSVCDLQKPLLNHLFNIAHDFKIALLHRKRLDKICRGKVLAVMFLEASTRTSCSFVAAMQRLGGTVIHLPDSTSSSLCKGETLEDTVRVLSSYADCVVIRHPGHGVLQNLVAYCQRPIINAGDGVGEHPTQALLDIFTIREEIGTVNNLTITMVGDLKNGRTVHSLARLLCLYEVRLRYVCPHPALAMPQDVRDYVAAAGIQQEDCTSLADALADTDVLYMTRLQKERLVSLHEADKIDKIFDSFALTPELMTRAKTRMIVLHPLPRNNEISPQLDADPRSAYFRQAEHGMYLRMALLASLLA